MIRPDGTRTELVWPVGFSARFRPTLEILDDAGAVIAREGDLVTGGCPMAPGGEQWVSFETPAPEDAPNGPAQVPATP